MGGIIFIVLALAAGGSAFYYFKILNPKQAVRGGTGLADLDELDLDGDEDYSDYGTNEQEDSGE